MKLVTDWRKWYRWYSTHPKMAGTVLTAVAGAMAISGGASAWLGTFGLGVVLLIASALFVLSFAGRLLQQGILKKLVPGATDESDDAGA